MTLDNFNILKSMTKEELMQIVPDDFKFRTEPWKHQIAAFLSCIANDSFLLALDLGTGKTKVAIDTCRYIYQQCGYLNAIVVCLSAAVEKWKEEIERHSWTLSALTVRNENIRKDDYFDGNSKITKTIKTIKREMLCDNNYHFRIINFEGLRNICIERMPDESGKNKEMIVQKYLQQILNCNPNILIIDESHKIKNPDSLTFQILNKLSQKSQHRFFLTGTPFHNLLDIWAQYYALDRGETFGDNYYNFRRTHFKEKRIYLRSRGYEISKWVITQKGKDFITSKMYSKAIRYDESEVNDMPDKVFKVINYNLSEEQMKDYFGLMAGHKIDGLKNLNNKSMIYRQICSGFIIKSNKIYKDNPKLKILEELIEMIAVKDKDKDKVVILYEFIQEFNIISKLLKKMKVKFTYINGQVSDKYKNNKLFLYDKSYKVCVVSIKSGSASIDLQSARYAIFYSNAVSVIDRKQAIKRIHRGDIKRTRFYYDLVALNTIEVSMQKSMESGINLFDEVMDGKKFFKILKGETDG